MQHINLCIGLPKKQKSILNFKLFKIILIGWVILLLAVYLILLLFYLTKPYTLYRLQKQRDGYNKLIIEKSKEKQLGEKGIALENEVSALKDAISDKEKILIIYKGQKVIRFTEYLKAFSLLTPNDVWLTSINLKPKENFIELQGHAESATLAITFLHDLDRDNLFKMFQLKMTKMQKEPKKNFLFTIVDKKDVPNEK